MDALEQDADAQHAERYNADLAAQDAANDI